MKAAIFPLACAILLGVVGCASSHAQSASAKPLKPTIITAAEWNSTPQPIPDERKQTPTILTIHHAGVMWKDGDDPFVKLKNLQSWGQKDKGWPDVPYHFLIAPDGRIFEGRDIRYEPESNTRYSLSGTVNVQLWGDFNVQPVTAEALKSTAMLCAWLADEYNLDLDKLRGHRDAAPGQTTCPGSDLYQYLESGRLRDWIDAARNGQEPTVELMEHKFDPPKE